MLETYINEDNFVQKIVGQKGKHIYRLLTSCRRSYDIKSPLTLSDTSWYELSCSKWLSCWSRFPIMSVIRTICSCMSSIVSGHLQQVDKRVIITIFLVNVSSSALLTQFSTKPKMEIDRSSQHHVKLFQLRKQTIFCELCVLPSISYGVILR